MSTTCSTQWGTFLALDVSQVSINCFTISWVSTNSDTVCLSTEESGLALYRQAGSKRRPTGKSRDEIKIIFCRRCRHQPCIQQAQTNLKITQNCTQEDFFFKLERFVTMMFDLLHKFVRRKPLSKVFFTQRFGS